MVTKQRLVILFLAAALVVTLAYIAVTRYEEARQKEQTNIFQQGIQTGYQQAIIQMMQQASTCQQIPLYAGNITLKIIAVDCLKQQ
jgi:Tfp pilus assembly protein PilO